MPLKVVGPVTSVSVKTTNFMLFFAGFHGPPDEDHPLQFGRQSSSPSRRASAAACLITSNHSGVLYAMGPSGISHPASKICAPPSPIAFIASRSAVMPSLETFPFIQCHQVCGLAEFGGFSNPFCSSADVTQNADPASAATVTNKLTLFIAVPSLLV